MVEDTAEPETEELVEVPRAQLVEWLSEWMKSTGSSRLGQSVSVDQPAGRETLAGYLIDGSGSKGGPVRAVIERLGHCETLARLVNEGLDAKRKVEAELRTERDTLRATSEVNDRLARERDEARAANAELQTRYDRTTQLRKDFDASRARVVELRGQLHDAVNAEARRQAWPGFTTAADAQGVEIETGVSYVSPHLVGEWKCTMRQGRTAWLERQGAPDDRVPPRIEWAGDTPLYLTEAPF